MNRKKRVCLSPLHLTLFLIVYLVDILLLLALRGYFFLVLAVLLTVFMPLSFCVSWHLAGYVTGSIACALPPEQRTIRQNEQVTVLFTITNKSWLCALSGTWPFLAGNSFYQTANQQKLVLSIPPHGKKQFQMTVTVTNLGRIYFACQTFFITDLLGIFKIHTDCAMECSFYVLPKANTAANAKLPETYLSMTGLSESPRKGSDYTEVSDVRAYRLGDRPRDIHWKLSARQSELMVKERTSLSDSEQILLLLLPPEKEKAEKLLREGYSKIVSMLQHRTAVRLLVWDDIAFTFKAHSCTSTDELDAAYCEIFQAALCTHNSGLIQQYMKNCFPQLEAYLCLTQKQDTVELEICTNG